MVVVKPDFLFLLANKFYVQADNFTAHCAMQNNKLQRAPCDYVELFQ